MGRLLPKILLHTRNRLILCVIDPKKGSVNEIHLFLGMTRHSLAGVRGGASRGLGHNSPRFVSNLIQYDRQLAHRIYGLTSDGLG